MTRDLPIFHPPRTAERPDVVVLAIESPEALDDESSRVYREAIQGLVGARPSAGVAVDLEKVDVLSSTGVGLLVNLKRRVEAAGGRLVLFGVQPDVHHQLRVTTLSRLFPIAEDRPSALALLRSATPM